MPDSSGLGELQELVRDLGKIPKDLSQEMRPMLKRTGEGALRDAKSNASWSSRIPGATRLAISFGKKNTGVSIRTNQRKAPHARPHENNGKPGTFRHPNFGRDDWSSQQARPYMQPAADKWQAQVDEEIGKVVDQVSRTHGFR